MSQETITFTPRDINRSPAKVFTPTEDSTEDVVEDTTDREFSDVDTEILAAARELGRLMTQYSEPRPKQSRIEPENLGDS